MRVQELNVKTGALFVLSYGEYDETYVYGPFIALQELCGLTLAQEFENWIAQENNLDQALNQEVRALHGGLPGGEQAEGHAFVVWLSETEKAKSIECQWMGFKAGRLPGGELRVTIDSETTQDDEHWLAPEEYSP